MAKTKTTCSQQISQEFHLPENLRAALWDLTSTMQEYHYPLSVSLRNSPPQTVLWSSLIARHLRCHRFFGCLSPIRGSLCALTNVAADRHGWTANVFEFSDIDGLHRHFSKSKKGIKIPPHFFCRKVRRLITKNFNYLRCFSVFL